MLTTNTDHGEVVNNCLADKEKRDEDNEVATFFFFINDQNSFLLAEENYDSSF